MDQRELEKLVQLMNDNGLVELEIERDGERVHLRKAGAMAPATVNWQAAPGAAPAAAPQTAQPAAASPAASDATPGTLPSGVKEILSPMVGTFYRKPNPDSDPYVSVGDRIDSDTVVCIVEAMKVNNELKAEMTGEIVEVLVEDGEPVEFDQPLFRVRSS